MTEFFKMAIDGAVGDDLAELGRPFFQVTTHIDGLILAVVCRRMGIKQSWISRDEWNDYQVMVNRHGNNWS